MTTTPVWYTHTKEADPMTQSVRSIYILVRLDFKGDDVSNDVVNEAVDNMSYDFSYNDPYVKIINSEIVEVYPERS